MILPSCAAAHAAPTFVSEYGALARDVGYTTPEISKRTVEQIVDDPEDDEDAPWSSSKIDQCVHMLKTNIEVLERYEKQVAAILERVPRAVSSQCSKGDSCSFRHDMNKRAKSTQPNPSPRSSTQQSVKNASRTRSPGQKPKWENCSIAVQGLPQRNVHHSIL